jgi:anti-anti-sigma factor
MQPSSSFYHRPMNIQVEGNTVKVTALRELDEASGSALREEALKTIHSLRDRVEIDLSQTRTINGGGLGALVHLQKACGNVCLINPMASVRQVLELARMDRIFEIVQR